jgi:hypothetical protein
MNSSVCSSRWFCFSIWDKCEIVYLKFNIIDLFYNDLDLFSRNFCKVVAFAEANFINFIFKSNANINYLCSLIWILIMKRQNDDDDEDDFGWPWVCVCMPSHLASDSPHQLCKPIVIRYNIRNKEMNDSIDNILIEFGKKEMLKFLITFRAWKAQIVS